MTEAFGEMVGRILDSFEEHKVVFVGLAIGVAIIIAYTCAHMSVTRPRPLSEVTAGCATHALPADDPLCAPPRQSH